MFAINSLRARIGRSAPAGGNMGRCGRSLGRPIHIEKRDLGIEAFHWAAIPLGRASAFRSSIAVFSNSRPDLAAAPAA